MSSEPNYYAIAKILGATMRPVKQARFGNFSLLETTAESLRSLLVPEFDQGEPHFSVEQNALVVQAFEDVRNGAAQDRILWDKELAEAFYRRCRDLGLAASD